jgi:AraC-like DNA-binding protein
VIGCIPDPRARGRVQTALRGHAQLVLFDTFAEVRSALANRSGSVTALVIGMDDEDGGSALAFARDMRAFKLGTSVVACCDLAAHPRAPVSAFAAAGVHDILFTGVNDDGHTARMVIFGAALGGAADVVMSAVAPEIPTGLLRFVDAAVRRPRELKRVAEIASALNVPRQTVGRWCRRHNFIRPEELLVWARLLLVGALLETTPRTLESIAIDLRYASPSALRNRIREYVGLTSTQIRAGGMVVVLKSFTSRVAEVRNGAD